MEKNVEILHLHLNIRWTNGLHCYVSLNLVIRMISPSLTSRQAPVTNCQSLYDPTQLSWQTHIISKKLQAVRTQVIPNPTHAKNSWVLYSSAVWITHTKRATWNIPDLTTHPVCRFFHCPNIPVFLHLSLLLLIKFLIKKVWYQDLWTVQNNGISNAFYNK